MVKSHLVRYDFVKDYTVWKFHEEAEDPSVGASRGGNSSTAMTMVVNAEQQTSSAVAGGHGNATSANEDRDYITMDDLLQDDDSDGDGDEPAGVMESRMWSFLRNLLTVLTTMMFCLGV
jgi:hypothetical protein